MQYYKTDVVNYVARKAGLTKKDAAQAVDAMTEYISEIVHNGDSVHLVNFGVFERRKYASRRIYNLETGEEMQLGERFVPSFKPSKILRELCKG